MKAFSWSLWSQVSGWVLRQALTNAAGGAFCPCSLPRMIIRHNYGPDFGTWPCTGMWPCSLYASEAVRVYYRQLQWLCCFFFPITHSWERLFVKKSGASVVCSRNLMFPRRMALVLGGSDWKSRQMWASTKFSRIVTVSCVFLGIACAWPWALC